jgi:hypothetical protein
MKMKYQQQVLTILKDVACGTPLYEMFSVNGKY